MPWWGILLVVIVAVSIGIPLLYFAVKMYIKEIREWRKQKQKLAEKDEPVISKEDALKQATKEFFIEFKPYFEYLEKGMTEQAAKFLFDYQDKCIHKTIACNKTIHCPECPYGGLVVIKLNDTK